MSDWIAEHRHDRVSEKLVDPSRSRSDDLGGPGEYLTHHSLDILGIKTLRHGGEAGEIAEDDRYLSPLGTSWGPGIEGVATLIAETRPLVGCRDRSCCTPRLTSVASIGGSH